MFVYLRDWSLHYAQEPSHAKLFLEFVANVEELGVPSFSEVIIYKIKL